MGRKPQDEIEHGDVCVRCEQRVRLQRADTGGLQPADPTDSWTCGCPTLDGPYVEE